nr:EOG090X00I4 [Lepidurus arcticus]
MLKFIRGKGSQPTAERARLQKELFLFQKTIQHGFPSKPSALAWDPELRLMALATKTGAIKVFGAPGVEFYGQHTNAEATVQKLLFLPGEGRLISLCDDNSLHLWEINSGDDGSHPVLEEKKQHSLEGKLKKVSALYVERSKEHLFIGTESGNIYLLNTRSFEMTETVIYLDVVMQNVTEDFKINPGPVEAVTQHPLHPEKVLIGYNRGLLVLWNLRALTADQTFQVNQQLESLSWSPSSEQIVTSHNDGSYITWNVGSKLEQKPSTPYGPFPCKPISKIRYHGSPGDDYYVFLGGMPRASYGEKNTVSVIHGEKHVVFDVTSRVIDFFTVIPVESEKDEPEALVILAEEELIVIDLMSDNWPVHAQPYLASLHASAVTAQHVAQIDQALMERIEAAGKKQKTAAQSERAWPINGGVCDASADETPSIPTTVLLTGHEDGSVNLWNASSPALKHLLKLTTAPAFITDDLDGPPPPAEEDEWPPFRKVGTFDPYSDDPRLAVKKLWLDPEGGTLAVAGTAGQLILAELKDEENSIEIPVTLINIVSDRDGFVWKAHDKLAVQSSAVAFAPGFQPNAVVQLHPPAAITALALQIEWGLLALGTAHGLALYDIVHKKAVTSKCTLLPQDLATAGEHPMTRRKSFKKSLRESFRRLRKGRSQRGRAGETGKGKEKGESASGATTAAEARPVERQVEARSVDDSMGSMVRCLYMAKTYLVNAQAVSPTLWAGTNSGAVFVFTLSMPSKREEEDVTATLAKEIQLRHRAPVIAISIVDATCAPLHHSSLEQSAKHEGENPGPHRVLICSEEQFKMFNLPNLRPHGKMKLTAYDGARIRRVAVVPFLSSADPTIGENCVIGLTNIGDVSVLSLPELRRQITANALRKEDIHGNSSLVFSPVGEGFYLHSSSEIQRFALSARTFLSLRCHLALAEGARPALKEEGEQKPTTPVPSTAAEVAQGEEKVTGGEAEKKDENKVALPELGDTPNGKGVGSPSHAPAPSPPLDHDMSGLSLSDMTIDSVKDHLMAALEESRVMEVKEVKSERVIVSKTTTITSSETLINAAEGDVKSTRTVRTHTETKTLSGTGAIGAPLAVAEETETAENFIAQISDRAAVKN